MENGIVLPENHLSQTLWIGAMMAATPRWLSGKAMRPLRIGLNIAKL